MTFPVVPLAFQRTIKVQRRQAGSYVDGRYIEPALVESDLKGSVQPATPRDLNQTPGGEDVTAGIKVYTNDAAGVKVTDVLIDGTESYRVISKTPWNYHGYYKLVAGLIDA